MIDAAFVDEQLRQTRGDRLFEFSLKDGTPAFVYVLLEHKSRPDPRTPLQILGYMVRIWERHVEMMPDKRAGLPAIVPLVIDHGQALWTVPTSVIDCLSGDEDWRQNFSNFRYILRDLGRIDTEDLSSVPHIRSVLLALKHGARGDAPFEMIVDIMSSLPGDSLLPMQVARYILSFINSLTANDWLQVIEAARPEDKEVMVSLAAQEWLNEGRAVGLKEGRAAGLTEGEAMGLRESVVDILETRFGPLDATYSARLSGLSAGELRPLGRCISVQGGNFDFRWSGQRGDWEGETRRIRFCGVLLIDRIAPIPPAPHFRYPPA